MSPEAISPLRLRMIEDMTIRQFGEKTKRDYVRQVREFTAFLGCSPDRAEPEDLRRYQLHLASLGASYARMNLAATALRFFFHVTLGRSGFGGRMARIPTPERLPVVLSPEEVALLLAHAPSLKYRAALSVAYGCGLRVSEIANLKVVDIDSARMLIRVEQGKGRKDRKDRFIATVPGIGLLGATAMAATVTDPTQFRSGRQFAAWLGLTPLNNSRAARNASAASPRWVTSTRGVFWSPA